MSKEMLLGVKKEDMKNKYYNMSALVLANMSGYVSKEANCRIFSKSEFKKLLKERLGISPRKAEIILNTFKDIGCLEIDKDVCRLNPVNDTFLKLDFETAKFCVDSLNELSFKTYCYLLNKYNIHVKYGYDQNYLFSKKELLQMAGYSYSYRNSEIMENCLQLLKSAGLLDFSDEPIYKKNGGNLHGQYRELYKANLRTIAQERGQKALKKEFTLTSGEIIMELETLKDKGVKKLYNGHLGGDIDIDKLIDMVNIYPTGAKCYLEYSRNKDENKEVYEKYLEEF